MLSKEHVAILTRPFDDSILGVKVQSFSKDRTKASLVLYLQHTDVAARLDEADPSWEFKVLNEWPSDNVYYVKSSLTIGGVTRENIGEGNEPKGAYSDALKRCAMLFGVGRNLYDSEIVWVSYNEQTDKYKQWTMEEYNKVLNKSKPSQDAPSCELCGTPMLLSKAGTRFYCPKFKDTSLGEHSTKAV